MANLSEKDYLPRWAVSDGDALLQEGLNDYSGRILKMVHQHRPDLALIVAAMKLSIPALESHLHDAEKAVCDMVIRNTVTVDLTDLQGGSGHD